MTESLNRIERKFRELDQTGRAPLRLFSGNPVENGILFPGEILREIYDRCLSRQEYRPHPKGLPEARAAVQQYYAGQGATVDTDNILMTSGSSESFFHLFRLLTAPGDNILAPQPGYPLFDEIARMARIELKSYPLIEDRAWSIDLDELSRRADARTRAIVLISPHNPTGAVATAEEIAGVVAFANRRDLPLICDEVFSEFFFREGIYPRPMKVASPRLCFTLNGISKMFALPQMKLGWIAVTGQQGLVEPAVDRLETATDTFLAAHTPIQQGLPALFSEGAGFVAGYRREVARRRSIALEMLSGCRSLRIVPPAGGFYLMAGATGVTGIGEEEFVIRLMEEQGVFVHPGYFYDYERGIHLVISFLVEETALRSGLKRITKQLENSR